MKTGSYSPYRTPQGTIRKATWRRLFRGHSVESPGQSKVNSAEPMVDNHTASEKYVTDRKKQVRVVAWALPRSCGTALLRAMWNKSCSKALIEPFGRAFFVGEERMSNWFVDISPPLRNQKFVDIRKNVYEAPYVDCDEIFVKDLAYYPVMAQVLSYKLDQLLPTGYVHTFLIRSPEVVVKSFYKMYRSNMLPGKSIFCRIAVTFGVQ